MKIFKSIILSGALVACAASAAPTTPAPKPLSFRADAKVEVDSDGKLVKVEASPDLPEGVRRYIEQEVSKWTFKRNPREGGVEALARQATQKLRIESAAQSAAMHVGCRIHRDID